MPDVPIIQFPITLSKFATCAVCVLMLGGCWSTSGQIGVQLFNVLGGPELVGAVAGKVFDSPPTLKECTDEQIAARIKDPEDLTNYTCRVAEAPVRFDANSSPTETMSSRPAAVSSLQTESPSTQELKECLDRAKSAGYLDPSAKQDYLCRTPIPFVSSDAIISEKIKAELSPVPTTNPTNTVEDRLTKLKSLLEKGLITKEEAAQKRKALAPSRDDIGKRFELAFWASIKDSTNAANFWDYLEKFPNGTFVGFASRRIETLKKNADNLGREDELSDWTRLKNSTNPDDYRAFLEQYPNSMFASLAKRRMGRRGESSDRRTTKRVALPVPDDRARSGHLRISIEEVEKDGNLEEFLSQFPPGKVRSDIEEQMKAWLAIKDSDLLEIDAELFLQRFRTGIVADRVQLELDDIHQEIDNADHGP